MLTDAVGTMVWTLFDYYGEPSGPWPHTTSSFGQFDLCGFPKAASYWYQSYWLRQIYDRYLSSSFFILRFHSIFIFCVLVKV